MSDSSGERTVAWEDPEILVIAVMGPTGTGKSTFINLLAGTDLGVGNQLESCTDTVNFTSPFEVGGKQIILIDTPGFDDSRITDADVLKMIAASLSLSSRESQLKLAGIIYMHRIIDNRMGGISSRNFRMFRHLCGDASLAHVVIVTTMWDQVSFSLGETRELELVTKPIFFEPAITRGARMARHDNTLQSAQTIILTILARGPSDRPLQIQEELEAGLEISATTAGQELGHDLREQWIRHQSELRVIMEDMQEAIRLRDEETRKELVLEREKLELMIKRLEQESTSLASGYAEALARLEAKIHISTNPGLAAPQPPVPVIAQHIAAAAETESNAILEGKLAAAFPILGFWGRLAVMLAPFSLSWK